MLADRQTYTHTQTDRQADRNTPLPYRGREIKISTRRSFIKLHNKNFKKPKNLNWAFEVLGF